MTKRWMALACVAGIALVGCKVGSAPENGSAVASTAANAQWTKFVNDFIETDFKARPGFAVGQGRHEYDGQIADLSPAAIAGEVARLKKAISDAEAFSADSLTAEQQFEREYLVATAKGAAASETTILTNVTDARARATAVAGPSAHGSP